MNPLISQGVEQLIAQLREEGVNAGKENADIIVSDAKKQASEILESAMADAEAMISNAKTEAESELQAGKNALLLAARDMTLEFGESLTVQFSREAERLVSEGLSDTDTIHKVILLLCHESLVDIGDISTSKKEILFSDSNTSIKQLVQKIGNKALESGVRFGTFQEDTKGIFVKLEGGKIKVDFTEKALAGALLEHLQPRFRDLLSGLLTQ